MKALNIYVMSYVYTMFVVVLISTLYHVLSVCSEVRSLDVVYLLGCVFILLGLMLLINCKRASVAVYFNALFYMSALSFFANRVFMGCYYFMLLVLGIVALNIKHKGVKAYTLIVRSNDADYDAEEYMQGIILCTTFVIMLMLAYTFMGIVPVGILFKVIMGVLIVYGFIKFMLSPTVDIFTRLFK